VWQHGAGLALNRDKENEMIDNESPTETPGLVAQLKLDLRAALVAAGEPTCDQLARLTGFSRSTINRTIRGDDHKLPRWQVLATILQAFRLEEDTITEWQFRWATIRSESTAVAQHVRDRHDPVPDDARMRNVLCDDCGSVVGDAAKHASFHEQFAPRQTRRLAVARAMA
jgi:transcriptional regulator with XRE-family HTH domain